ncbi:OmpA family protein [Chromatium okenii]|uniref:OmpA family protein n=1 Tax=Chromatium okenii TaxID=61644 RepID=UPI0026E928EB|nr:OmpA family protein [Chromatium okenii]MBV5308351.1 OmpA family protein [Chromatium okenii]
MSDANTSFWKSTALFLLLALIGVYVLYDWYDGTLQTRLSQKETYIAQTVSWIKAGDTRSLQPEDNQDAIRSAILTLELRNKQDKADLEQRLAAATAAQTETAQKLETQTAAHAAALAAEQEKTAQVRNELERQTIARNEIEALYREAKSQAVDLQSKFDQVRESVVAVTAEHQARITELEHHLNERVTLARTTPLDAEMLQMAQAAGVLPPSETIAEDHQELTDQLAEVQLRLEEVQSQLDAARTETTTAREQFTEVKQQFDDAQIALAQMKTQAAEDAVAAETATQKLAELTQQFEDAQTALAQMKTQTASTVDELAENERQRLRQQAIFDAQTEQLAALKTQQAAAQQEREELLQKHQDAVQALTDTLAATKQQLATVEHELQTAPTAAVPAQPVETTPVLSAPATESTAATTTQVACAETEQALRRLQSLYAGFAALGATYTPHGLLLRLNENEVRFQPGQATLLGGELPSVTRIAELLKEQPTLTVRVEGHTDRSGNDELNKTLSQQRAEAVKQALIARGVDAVRLTAEGIGSARPLADNATAAGRSQNRRVEVYVSE